MSVENIVTVDKYFQFLANKKLMGSKCSKCGTVDLPPRRLCSNCLGETAWIELSGKGVLKTFSSIYVGARVMVDKGYNRKRPYIFAVCQMNEGPSISGLLLEKDGTKPDEIPLDSPVEVTYISSEIGKNQDGSPLLRWDLAFKFA